MQLTGSSLTHCGPTICSLFPAHTLVSVIHFVSPTHTVLPLPAVFIPHAPCSPASHLMPPALFLICLYTLWDPANDTVPSQAVIPAHTHFCYVHRVHRTASGNLWPLEYPRSPLRFAFSTRISSRKLPSPSLDCPSTMVSWAVG